MCRSGLVAGFAGLARSAWGELFGEERRRLRSIGRLIGDFDLLIGCSAKKYGLKVSTNNLRHFGRIEGIEIESIAIQR